ncbi:restriction endonuclease subunit S [Empedobacter tilapiae]
MENRVKLKYIANIYKGKKPNNEYSTQKVGFLPYLAMDLLRGRNVIPSYVDINNEKVVTVKSDDILIIWDGSNSGEIVPAKEGVLSSTMGKISLKSNNFNTNYIKYNLINYEADLRGNTIGMGIPHVNGEILRNLNILSISLQEQQKIAEYLDDKTALIDEIIKKKQNLIQALDDKKKALINDLVTGKMVWNGTTFSKPKITKDSGIQWLGDIPEHWEVKKLGHLGKFQNGVSKGGEYFGEGYPFVNYGDIYKNPVLPENVLALAKSTEQDQIQYSVKAGDVFFTRTSETIDEIGIASTCIKTIEKAVFSGFTIRFRQDNEVIIKDYAKYLFRSEYVRTSLSKEMNLITRASLSQSLLKSLVVFIPLVKEQLLMTDYLDSVTNRIDLIKSKISTQIEKLKEYRQAVIAEAVTGKIDVRNWTKPNN